jgi:hypothetical protein
MDQLDLHGIRHEQVPRLVENFVLLNDLPVRIVTGNSFIMKKIVTEVVETFGLKASVESDWNLGALIVTNRS